jgi:flagellin
VAGTAAGTASSTGVFGVALGGALSSSGTINTETADIINTLDTAIAGVASQRATFGAAMNRLEYTVDNLMSVSQNTSASRSRIEDADNAAETTELARAQIIAQAATAMLSQANQQAQSVLALLK